MRVGEFVGLSLRRAISSGAKESSGNGNDSVREVLVNAAIEGANVDPMIDLDDSLDEGEEKTNKQTTKKKTKKKRKVNIQASL